MAGFTPDTSGTHTHKSALTRGAGGKKQSYECTPTGGTGDIEVTAEGRVSGSSNLFARRDSTIISPGEQFRRYGLLGTLVLWLQTFRLGGEVEHFLWARPKATRPDDPRLQWWTGTLVNALIFLLAMWRAGLAEGFTLATIFGAALAVVTLFGLRKVVMKLAARLLGLMVRHRAWEAALSLSAGIALIFGWFFPHLRWCRHALLPAVPIPLAFMSPIPNQQLQTEFAAFAYARSTEEHIA